MQSGEKLLVEAYAAIWLILFAMILLSWRRQRQIDRRVDALAASVARAREGSGKGAG
jgi:CcmD family protein